MMSLFAPMGEYNGCKFRGEKREMIFKKDEWVAN